MTPDLELLQLAAKAAGLLPLPDGKDLDISEDGGLAFCGNGEYVTWEPLTDDGDALRLADALELDILHRVVGGTRVEILPAGGPLTVEHYIRPGNRLAATRRAIVIAAAEIGRRMP